MKRIKLLVFMMISFLCFGITSVSAAAPGELFVGGVDIIKDPDYTLTLGSGTAKYNPITTTLTLDNATHVDMIDAGSGIDLTVEIVNNNFTGRIITSGNLTIIGSGKLTIETLDGDAIYSHSTLTIREVTLDLKSSGSGINSAGNILIDTADITAKGVDVGIMSAGNIVIENSVIDATATEDERNAILSSSGTITIKDSDITAESYYPSIFSEGLIEITDSELNLTSTNDISIYSKNKTITILDTELNLDETKDFREYATISYITNANYSELDELLKNIPADLKNYTNESILELNNVIDGIVRTLTNQDQDTVDDYVDELDRALKNLKLKGANYDELDEMLTKIPKELSKYTDKSVKKLNDLISNIDRKINITNQDQVDELVSLIADAIKNLEEKPEENPKTFDGIDNSIISSVISLMGLIGTGLYTTKKRFN